MGIIASTFYFAFCYARVGVAPLECRACLCEPCNFESEHLSCCQPQANMAAFTIQPSRSGVMRTWDQRIILDVRIRLNLHESTVHCCTHWFLTSLQL